MKIFNGYRPKTYAYVKWDKCLDGMGCFHIQSVCALFHFLPIKNGPIQAIPSLAYVYTEIYTYGLYAPFCRSASESTTFIALHP